MKQANTCLAARRARKAELLPRAAALAAEGRSYKEIAVAIGIAKSTVCQWLRDRPLGRAAAQALGTPRMTAKLAARYESLYHRALREWNRSRSDRRTETVLTIEPAGGGPTTKTTVRTEPRTGNTACLGKALAAMKAMEGLHCRERLRQECAAGLDAAAAGEGSSEGAVTRTVTTTMTRSGPQRRTVITRRLGDAMPATPGRQATSGSEESSASGRESDSLAGASGPDVRRLAGASRSGVQPLACASGGDVGPLACASGFDGASSGAALVNGGTAKRPSDWRKAFVPNDLRLRMDEFASVSRSATLPNDPFQKGGSAKGQKRTKRDRRKARRRAAQESGPPAGSADNLARELDLAFGSPNLSPG